MSYNFNQYVSPNFAQADYWSITPLTTTFSILGFNPASGQSNVAIGVNPFIQYSLLPLSGSTSFLLKDSGNNNVAGSLSYNFSNNVNTFVPTSQLQYNSPYTAITSASGLGVKLAFSWPFTTAASSTIPSSHTTFGFVGKLLQPQQNLVITTTNITQLTIYY